MQAFNFVDPADDTIPCPGKYIPSLPAPYSINPFIPPQKSPSSLPLSQLPRRPRFTGGGDLDALSLYRLLFAGTGLADRLPPRRGGLGDREYESRRLPLRTGGGGDKLAGLARLGGDCESYEGDRLFFLPCPLLTDELLRRFDPGPAFPRGRPR